MAFPPRTSVTAALAAAIVIVAFLVASARDVHATTAYRLTLDELVEHADAIVQARVTDVEARWTTQPRQIWRFASLAVEQVHHNETGDIDVNSEITVRARGGTVGDITAHVPGAAPFEAARDAGVVVLVFLWEDPDGQWQVVGMTQGLFTLQPDEAGDGEDATPRFVNSYAGLCLVDRDAKALSPRDALAAALPMRVTETELRDAIENRE